MKPPPRQDGAGTAGLGATEWVKQQTILALSDINRALKESLRDLRVFPGNEPPRGTVFFFKKYSIGSIYFVCFSDKIRIERRPNKIRNKVTMGST